MLNFFWSHQEDPNRQLWWWQKLLWETSLPPLPKNFEELIGGEKCVKSFLKGISLPREFNALFSAFIDQLAEEKNALGTETPFVGAQSCSTVEKAIKNLKAKELQEKKGREIKEVSDSGENGREERKNDEF